MADLMYKAEIQGVIRDVYSRVQVEGRPDRLMCAYSDQELASLPEQAVSWSFGTGHPVAHARLQPGEVVVDLGSGGGIDAILAARRVGSEGHVVGIDLLPDMAERATQNAAAAGVHNTEFRVGEIEAIPLPDDSADVVLSNGVVSLSARKARVFAEARRVLKAGGRLCLSDMTLEEEQLPSEILVHPAAWAG
ncbi:MAG: methyltransferase domain-containing protein [Nitriliruptorales bacterium]|nr:methyltransferase domain-containing protein [Nitriliruptorales bacterium]